MSDINNDNTCTELTIKRKPTLAVMLVRAGLICLGAGAAALIWYLGSWWMSGLCALCVLAAFYTVWPFTVVEYEYVISEGEWRFAKIYGHGRRRDPRLTVKLSDIEEVFCLEHGNVPDDCRVYDFRPSRREKDNMYCAVVKNAVKDASGKSGRLAVLFAPSEKSLGLVSAAANVSD